MAGSRAALSKAARAGKEAIKHLEAANVSHGSPMFALFGDEEEEEENKSDDLLDRFSNLGRLL